MRHGLLSQQNSEYPWIILNQINRQTDLIAVSFEIAPAAVGAARPWRFSADWALGWPTGGFHVRGSYSALLQGHPIDPKGVEHILSPRWQVCRGMNPVNHVLVQEIWHEVLESHADRYALTVWIHDRERAPLAQLWVALTWILHIISFHFLILYQWEILQRYSFHFSAATSAGGCEAQVLREAQLCIWKGWGVVLRRAEQTSSSIRALAQLRQWAKHVG